jgi:hypothetical protein
MVNANREATIRIVVSGPSGQQQEIEAIIDTGFTGFLTLPPALIQALGLAWLCRCTQVGEPGPRQDTFDGDDHLVPRGRDGLEQGVGTGVHMPAQHNLAILTQETDVHGAGMQVDAAVTWVWRRRAPHEVSSCCASGGLLMPADHRGMLRRGPQ